MSLHGPSLAYRKNPLNLETTMFKTKNGLSEATRVKAIELVNGRLANCIDLQTQTKHAKENRRHWQTRR